MLALIKAFNALLLPPAINLLVALFGFVMLAYKRKLGLVLVFLSVFSLYLVCTTPVSNLLLSRLESYPALPERIIPGKEQAIVVLGGGRYPDAPEYSGDTVNTWTLERLRYAAMLVEKTHLPLLVSGGRLHGETLSEAQLMKQVLEQSFNVRVRWEEPVSRNTAENAKYSADILRSQGIANIYLVTQASHMKRAVWAFEREGFIVTPAPTGFTTPAPGRSLIEGLIPDAKTLADSSFALHEYLGLVWYRMRY